MADGKGKYIELAPQVPPGALGKYRPHRQTSILQDLTTEEELVGKKTPALGATGKAFRTDNKGFYAIVNQAYNGHYVLKTCPEDWWYCITQKVALAIDENSKNPDVRSFFVKHEDKKVLTVRVGPSIYGVNYSWFFDQMAKQIEKNVEKPEFVKIMNADFSQTTNVQNIVNKVVLMTSMKEYFEYKMELKCGIPGVVMKGSEDDWVKLSFKLRQLEVLLKPIEKSLKLDGWWDGCGEVCSNLLKTHQGSPDQDWWSRIIAHEPFGSGPQYVRGWFVTDFLGLPDAEECDIKTGLVACPLTITDNVNTDLTTVVAGIAGYKHNAEEVPCEQYGGFYPSVEAVHTWALMMEPDAFFRSDLVAWQEKHIGG